MKQIKTAIIGFGLSGKVFHARVLRSLPEFAITWVATSRADEVMQELPEARVATCPLEILSDKSVDLVVIATPTGEHATLAINCLEAGKHVVVEKPFTISLHEARTVAQCVERTGKTLSVFHNRRWDNGFLTLKRELAAGNFGALYQYEARFDRFRPQVNHNRWREHADAGSGILYDLGSHLIDQALHLFGRPRSLFCDMKAQRPGAITDDYFNILLDYGSLQATLRAGSVVGIPGPVLQLHGEYGSFLKQELDPQELALRSGMRPENSDGMWGLDNDPALMYRLNAEGSMQQATCETIPGAYHDFYRCVFKAITEGAPAPVSAIEGLAVIELIEACLESARQGRRITL